MKKHGKLLCKILSAALALSVAGGIAGAAPVTVLPEASLTVSASTLPVVTAGNFKYRLYNSSKTAVMVGYVGKKDFSTSQLSLPSVVYSKDMDNKDAVGAGIDKYTVTELDANIFKGCVIKLLSLPQSLESINGGFVGATIGGFHISSSNKKLKTDGIINALYSKDGTRLYAYPSKQQLCNTSYGSKLILGSELQYIGNGAFANYQLTSITLPKNVTGMGESVFAGSKLTSVTFEGNSPEFTWTSLTRQGTFEGAANLSYINIKGKDGKYNTDSYGVIYSKDKTALYYCPEGKTAAFTLPEACTTIRSYAFYNSRCNGPVIYNQKISIMDDAFKNISDNFTIYGLKDSSLSGYLNNKNIKFKYVFDYTVNADGKTVTITGYNGPYKSFTIPSKLNGMTVTAIGDGAFRSRTDITSIFLPSELKLIGRNAFMNCTNLVSVVMPDTVTSIGEYAFYKTAITSVSIPKSMTSVNDYAFYGCDKMEKLSIPANTTCIGNYSFAHCTSLKAVTIPDNVTEIKAGAFYNCTSMTKFDIGKGVRVIGSYSFENVGLISQFIPQSVTYIGTNAFGYTYSNKTHSRSTNFTKITGYPGTNAEKYAKEHNISFVSLLEYKTDGGNVIITKYSGSDTTLDVPGYIDGKPVKCIDQNAFKGNNTLKKLTINAPIKELRSQAFYGMTALESISLPGSLTDIGSYAFAGCGRLNDVSIQGAPANIAAYAFLDCKSLTKFSFADGLESIGSAAFANTGLNSASLPKTVSYIGANALGYTYNISTNTYSPLSSFTLSGYAYTAADNYAADNSFITFIPRYENIESLSTISANDVNCGQDITVKAAVSGGKKPYLYKVYYESKGTTDQTLVSDFSSETDYSFHIDVPGIYEVCVQARDARGLSYTQIFYVTVHEYTKLANKSTITKKELVLGDTVTVNCTAAGGTAPYQYAVFYKKSTAANYSAVQSYSTNTSVTITPQAAATYNVLVKVKDADGNTSKKTFTLQVCSRLANTSSLSATAVKKGQKVTVQCNAKGGKAPYLYYVGYKKSTAENYTTVQYYKSETSVDITPASAVKYNIIVRVKDKMGNIKEKTFTISVTK